MPQALLDKLRSVLARKRLYSAARGALLVAGVWLVAAILMFRADTLVHFTTTGRIVSLLGLTLVPFALLLLFTVLPAAARIQPATLAIMVERTYPVLNERLLTTVSLAATAPSNATPVFAALSTDTTRAAEPLDFRRAVSSSPVRRAALVSALCAAGLAVQVAVSPAAFAVWMRRTLNPRLDLPVYAETTVHMLLVKSPALVGTVAPVVVSTSGRLYNSATIHFRTGSGAWHAVELTSYKDQGAGGTMSARRFLWSAPAALPSVTLYAESGDGRSNLYTLRVEERPAPVWITLRAVSPAYTHVAPATVSGASGNMAAPVGARVTVTVKASKATAAASLLVSGLPGIPLHVSGDTATGEVLVKRDTVYAIGLQDRYGFTSQDSTKYRLHAIPDCAPSVSLTRPVHELQAAPNAHIPFGVAASDDYGVTALWLNWSKGSHNASIPIPVASGGTKVSQGGSLNLSPLALHPGDTLVLHAIATDNAEPGRHRSTSAPIEIHIRSATEIREALRAEAVQEQQDLRDLLRSQQQSLAAVVAMRGHSADAAKAAEQLTQQRSITNTALRLADRMRATTEAEQSNGVEAPAALQRANATAAAIAHVANGSMARSSSALQKAATVSGPRESHVQEAATQDRESVDALKQLADSAQPAESVAQLASQADKVAATQQQLADDAQLEAQAAAGAATSADRRKAQLAMRATSAAQARLAAQTAELAAAVQHSLAAALEQQQASQQALEQATRALRQPRLAGAQQAAEQMLGQGNAHSAATQQKLAAEDLREAANALDPHHIPAADPNADDRASAIERLATQLISLASRERALALGLNLRTNPDSVPGLRAEQGRLRSELNKLSPALSQVPDAAAAAQQAGLSMDSAETQMGNGHWLEAAQPAMQAVRDLYRAAMEAETAARNTLDRENARAAVDKLKELAASQTALKLDTGTLDTGTTRGEIKPSDAAEKSMRLAVRQSSLAEAVHGAMESLPDSSFKWAAAMAQQRMKTAEQSLRSGNTSADTQARQQRAAEILSRLVRALAQDLQKSGKQNGNQSGKQQNGQPAQNAEMQNVMGQLGLAREMQAQIRSETGALDTARQSNPNGALSAEQEIQATDLASAQEEARRIAEDAGNAGQSSLDVTQLVRQATAEMYSAQTGLGARQTDDAVQNHQRSAAQLLDGAINAAKQAMREKQQSAQGDTRSQSGPPRQSAQSGAAGKQPMQRSSAPVESVVTGTRGAFSQVGIGFHGLSPRALKALSQGRQQSVPPQYKDLVEQYYKALAESGIKKQ